MTGWVSSVLLIALAGLIFGLVVWYMRRATRAARSRVGTPLRQPVASAAKLRAPVRSAKPALARALREDAGLESSVAKPGPRFYPPQTTEQVAGHPVRDLQAEKGEAEIWKDTVADPLAEPSDDPRLTTEADASLLPPEPRAALSASSATVPALEGVDQSPLDVPVVAIDAAGPEAGSGVLSAAAIPPEPAGDLQQQTPVVATPVAGALLLHATMLPAEAPQPVVSASTEAKEKEKETAPLAVTPVAGASIADAALRTEPLPTAEEVEAVAPAPVGATDEPDQAARPAVSQVFVAGIEHGVGVTESTTTHPREAPADVARHDLVAAIPKPAPRNVGTSTTGVVSVADSELQPSAAAATAPDPSLEAMNAGDVELLPAVGTETGVAEAVPLSAEGAAASDTSPEITPGSDAGVTPEAAAIDAEPGMPEAAGRTVAAPAAPLTRPAVHRDRRSRPAAAPQQSGKEPLQAANLNGSRPPAEARLRLSVHPIRRTVQLALVLMRPDEYPARITLLLDGSQAVDALGDRQYGDVDLKWSAGLLSSEIRLTCAEGFHWVRSARFAHIFAADPTEPDLVTVAFASAGTEHTIVCRNEDAGAVCDLAESAGSSRPRPLERFTGITDGWVVLTGYRPTRAAAVRPSAAFSPLDPGHAIAITLDGGLAIRPRSFAQGKPPQISVEPALEGVSVRIDGAEATPRDGGGWEASGWDAPGTHLIDVVPGPTLKYEIIADPATNGGWAFWDAHADRAAASEGPWAHARICGAGLEGPSGEKVLAADMQPTLLALGIDGSVASLRARAGVDVSVGLAGGTPAFLLVSSGRRRAQGKVVWLGLAETTASPAPIRHAFPVWIEAIRSAAARRLPVELGEDGAGESTWRQMVALARAIKRQRR
jgi:hypothetical protein